METVAIRTSAIAALWNVGIVLSWHTVDGSNVEEAPVAGLFFRRGHPPIQSDEENSPLVGLLVSQLSDLQAWSDVVSLAAHKSHIIALSSFEVAVLGIVPNGVCENGSGGKCQDRK